MDFANIFTEFTVKKLKTFYYKELKGVRRSYRSFCSLGKLEANGWTDGAARGEPSLLELSRVVTEEDEVKIDGYGQGRAPSPSIARFRSRAGICATRQCTAVQGAATGYARTNNNVLSLVSYMLYVIEKTVMFYLNLNTNILLFNFRK